MTFAPSRLTVRSFLLIMVLMLTRTRVLPLAAAALVGLAACSAPGGTAPAETPRVVAAFYPLEWVATEVMGSHGSVGTLTDPGMEAHDLELSAQQVASLATADLVIHLSDFQPAVDEAVAQSSATAVIDAADVVDLLPVAEEHSHEEHADEDHSDDEGADEHDHGDLDPHFWQDPTRMSVLLEAVRDELVELDPDNADDYRANAETAIGELAELDEEYSSALAECVRREFITTHAAFGYLAARYELTEIGVSGVNPDDEPSPARIAEIHDEATAHGITTIFFETLTSDAVAASIAGDLDLETAILDPLEGVTEQSPGTDYPSIMRANLSALAQANECS